MERTTFVEAVSGLCMCHRQLKLVSLRGCSHLPSHFSDMFIKRKCKMCCESVNLKPLQRRGLTCIAKSLLLSYVKNDDIQHFITGFITSNILQRILAFRGSSEIM